jgi:hypothetical protein
MSNGADKVVVTNVSALKRKYASQGYAKLQAAVRELIAADQKRGLKTIQVGVDDATAMGKLKAKPVTDPANARQNKVAIDGVYQALKPDYLMILGSIDVIPHQDLVNPAYDPSPDGDPDRLAPGDLPYACDAPYSTAIADFTGPTRVVARLPDLTNGNDPAYLVGLLTTAANYKGKPAQEYSSFLGISADVWKASTSLSLQAAFGASSGMQVSPPDGPDGQWPAGLLGRRSHYINCHGASADDQFYGQPDHQDDYPIAFKAGRLPGKTIEGTVVAAECCYGAELYDPALTGGRMGNCNTYLAEKAYGYFGSTTIAYGPEDHNDNADLICQYYFKHVVGGSSSGRAALQARLDLIAARSPLDPYNAKTLGQYLLIGDPSIHPVVSPAVAHLLAAVQPRRGKARTEMVSALSVGPDPWGANRALRRHRLEVLGKAIGASTRVAHPTEKAPHPRVRRALVEAAETYKLKKFSFRAYAFPSTGPSRKARGARLAHAMPSTAGPSGLYVATAALPRSQAPVRQLLVLIAKEIDGSYIIDRLTSR